MKSYPVIISAFGAWTEETLPLHQKSLEHLANILSGKENRLLIVGGAGSLYVDESHTTRLMDTPEFPDMFIPLATAMGEAFDNLKDRNDVNWTYLSPSADFQADGQKTGQYVTGKDDLLVNSNKESVISYADYAIAMIDEVENGNYIKQRFTVCSK